VLLLLIGSGPLEHDVRDTVARLGLTDHVRLLGARMDVPDLLPALDVFALSSHYEGLPVSILEAMATGLPTVASAVGGVPEAITDGVEGWLVQRGDPKQFADRLGRLLGDPESRRRMGAHARQRVEDCYSINRLVNDIESAYTDALLPSPAGDGTETEHSTQPLPGSPIPERPADHAGAVPGRRPEPMMLAPGQRPAGGAA
jgi:glycosyltransferase involved in cell wall biosynthesis